MDKGNPQRTVLKSLWGYLRRHRAALLATLLLAFCSVGLTIYVPVLVGQCIDLIVGPSEVDFSRIASLLTEIGVIVVLTSLISWLMDMLNNKITFLVVRDIRNQTFLKVQNLPLQYIDRHSHGDILSRIIADTDQLADGLLMGFTQLFTGVLTIIGTLLFMVSLSPFITLLVVALTPFSLFAANFIAKRTYSLFHLQSDIRGRQTAFMDEMINGQKVVQAFSREQAVQERFDEINDALEKASLKATFFSSITNPSTRFINGLVYAAVALSGTLSVLSGGGITVGGLAAFLSYANQYTKPFNEISGVFAELQNAFACAARIFELIGQQEQEKDPPDARDLRHIRGEVRFRHVFFSYSKKRSLIQNFHLDVPAGSRVAIVGPTGCGKTTLINLLMRFYDVDRGEILVDGTDIRRISRASLRKGFGMVLQDTWLRQGTIRDNITIGKPDATDQQVIAAAKATHAHSFIKRLPNGYDTVIGGDDGGLSQGQRQMLCITRVMLCEPPMLILDEATSAIDTRTEVLIQQAFEALMQGRTSFIVAHRLSTIQNADLILVMENGNVIEQGRHKELLEKNGHYTRLYNSQFKP